MSDNLHNKRSSHKGTETLADIEQQKEEGPRIKGDEGNRETNLLINLFEKQTESQLQLMKLVANAFHRTL